MFRKLLIALVLLIVVLVVAADRVGAHVAAHVLAGKLETDEHLSSRPSVTIGGWPFLTQAVEGHYSDVTVRTGEAVTSDHVDLDTMTVHLMGVHIPLSKVISGSVKTVPVDRVTGTVAITFSDLESYLTSRGITVKLSPSMTFSVANSVLTVSEHLGATGARLTTIPVPLGGLPFRLTVTSVRVSGDGLVASGTARDVVLGS
ncbi:MAG TPA: DUF2993 domain-containing protein [Mycobacteriales bacterium]|nr:DUF2993 domain-containing protein [Mycobacteriales bacterium]